MTTRRRILASAALAGALAAVGIGSAAGAHGSSKAAAPSLKSVCGDKIVIQTDWFPEPEHAAVYQLAGTNGSFEKAKGRYTGTIGKTGVKLEIRAGGPFTGFQQPISQLYQDSSITLGYVNSDEAVRSSKTLPTVAVVTPLEFSPQILMWNPQELNIKTFEDIERSNAKVLVFEGGVWVDYLIGRGWIRKSQVDTSYDGSPARFITSDGGIVQQAFVTSEPYDYEHVISQYGKPVSYLLIRNSGYVPYPEALAAKPDVVKKMAPCFKQLVPLIQQAEVDYIANPKPTNAKLIDIVTQLNTFWKLTPGGVAYNAATQKRLKLVQDGPDCTLGNFSMKRLKGVVNQLLPIYKEQNVDTVKDGIKASDIATNQFIDPKIGLPKAGCK
jgi:hypothetical protein